jgi:hypothetical protein
MRLEFRAGLRSGKAVLILMLRCCNVGPAGTLGVLTEVFVISSIYRVRCWNCTCSRPLSLPSRSFRSNQPSYHPALLSPHLVVGFIYKIITMSMFLCNTLGLAEPELRLLVAGFPPRRTGFELRSDHLGFVMDIVALG